MTLPMRFGEKGEILTTIGRAILLRSFCFAAMQINVHVKFNKEFIKALNVAVARILGWIHSAEDIAAEFTPEGGWRGKSISRHSYFAGCCALLGAPGLRKGMEHYTPAPGVNQARK